MDTKKKEFWAISTQANRHPGNDRDHDHDSAVGVGTVIPHSLYDVEEQLRPLNTSHDTSELACDSLAACGGGRPGLLSQGQETTAVIIAQQYPTIIFKEDLRSWRTASHQIPAHYPPYSRSGIRLAPPVPPLPPQISPPQPTTTRRPKKRRAPQSQEPPFTSTRHAPKGPQQEKKQ